MDVRHAHTARISGNLRVVPLDRESDRSIAEHAKVVAIVGVLRNPFTGKDEVFPECLLDPCMVFIAKARAQRPACRDTTASIVIQVIVST